MAFYFSHAGTEHTTAIEAAAHETQNTSLLVVIVTILAIIALAVLFRSLHKPSQKERL